MAALSNLGQLHDDAVTTAKRLVAGGQEDTFLFDRELTSALIDTDDVFLPGLRQISVITTPLEEDRQSDASAVVLSCQVVVTVYRALNLDQHPDDEKLYRSEEMLFGMENLLDKALWESRMLALSTTINILEGPEITTQPEREGNLVTYAVTFTTEYTAD